MRLPEPVKQLIHNLSELPSIGPRQATRLAFYLIQRGQSDLRGLRANLEGLERIKTCSRCFFIHERAGNLCDICENPGRDHGIVMVVEKETDLISIENTGKYGGRYFVLGPISRTGLLDDMQKLRLQNLKNFAQKDLGGKAKEIILGFNPTSFGDFHASLITKELAPFAKKISRLGRGLPTGGEIEFADDDTLGSALEGRA